MSINPEIDLLTGPELHRQVIQDAILSAESYVWIHRKPICTTRSG